MNLRNKLNYYWNKIVIFFELTKDEVQYFERKKNKGIRKC